MAYVIELRSGRLKAAYKDHVKGVWTRKTVPDGTTKRECERLANELEHNSWLRAEGLAVRRAESPMKLGELVDWWLKERCPSASLEREKVRLTKHVQTHRIATLRLGQVDSSDISSLLHQLEKDGAAPGSINRLRASLHSIFAHAIDAKKWTGANPVAGVKTRPVPKRAYHLLRAEEVPTVLEAAGDTWRDLCATAIYLGLRKGELFALRKQDVNLADREITIGRSHMAATTKGRKAVVLPIPTPLQPFLEHAVQSAPGEFVFPRADGTQRPESTATEKVWHRILVRAGVIVGYRHTCQRCVARKQPATHEFPDAEQRRCPTCTMRMWPSAIPRPMRFHDVRHTTATLLLKAGVPIQHVQRILRHANIRTTVDTYGHLANEDLRAPLELLPAPTEKALPPPIPPRHVPNMCQAARRPEKQGPGADSKSATAGPIFLERNTGFEPATFALARRRSTS